MLSTLLLIYLVHWGNADAGNEFVEIMPRCSNSPMNMTFTPVEGYNGRYTAEFCTQRNLTHREWELHVYFYKTRDYCDPSMNPSKKLSIGQTHSSNVEWVSSNHNCTGNQTVCMSAQFDLIFSACYAISTRFMDVPGAPKFYYFDIVNNNTEQQFYENHANVDLKYYDDYMSVTWHTGVPLSVYKVELYNETESMSGEPVPNCTTTDLTTIKCYLSPDYGCYTINLQHIAPWIGGIFFKQESVPKSFCRNDTSAATPAVSVSARQSWPWAVAGAGAALVLLGGVACLARRARAATRRQLKVLGSWLKHGSSAEGRPVLAPRCRHVLLLRAREGAAAARALAALSAALRQVIDGQVWDIYSAEVVAQCAGAPGEWVRRALRRDDVAVLLLQSPALQAAQPSHHRDGGPVQLLAAPRVVPREPQFGDALLQFALRLLTENLLTRDDYNKYYVATISALPTEVVPALVPYRRYPLPAAAPLLLRDLCPPHRAPPPPDLTDRFTQALMEFVDHVKENPEYLMDELMVVDN